MSNYLVNLARRSAGLAPVAQPRVGPGGGPDARFLRGAARPFVPPPPDGTPGPSLYAATRPADEAPGDGPAPRRWAADDVARRTREPEPQEVEASPKLRLVESGRRAVGPGDARTAAPAGSPPATGTVMAPVTIRPARHGGDDGSPDARLHRRLGNEASDREPDAAPGTVTPRDPAIEPSLSLAHLASARTATEPRGRGRDVEVRIGTIEIHAEPAGPAAAAPPALAMPATPGRAQGGFDDFVRLRTYAPWER